MAKVKIIRDYNGFKGGDIFDLEPKIADFLIQNQIAKLSDCGGDCEECEDCKGKKKKKPPVKKRVTKSKRVKKPSAKK